LSDRALRILVVADPVQDAPLHGAQEEGEAVASIFEEFGREKSRTVEVVRAKLLVWVWAACRPGERISTTAIHTSDSFLTARRHPSHRSHLTTPPLQTQWRALCSQTPDEERHKGSASAQEIARATQVLTTRM
jgi:hypothetical protein